MMSIIFPPKRPTREWKGKVWRDHRERKWRDHRGKVESESGENWSGSWVKSRK